LIKDRYGRGEKINIATKAGLREYWKALQYQQKKNMELGYGNRDWIKKDYENSLKNIWKEKKNKVDLNIKKKKSE
jgi:aryl-alcohol dehydrogenase-like predicted oxidoreductase